jgi:glutaredoxin-like YruB-family protein
MAHKLIPEEKNHYMAVRTIHSHSEMLNSIRKEAKNYILLYKSGSESGNCSLTNVLEAAEKFEKVNVLVADVAVVRDIHTEYNISSAPSLLVFEGERFINVVKGCNNPAFYISLFEESYFHPANKDGLPKQKRVTVYSTPSCSWCTTLKNYLKSQNIQYTDVDVSRNQQAAEDMVRRSGQQGVPQIDIEGRIIVGFDKNKINSLLGIQQSNN